MKKKRRKLLAELCSDLTLPELVRFELAKHLFIEQLRVDGRKVSEFSSGEIDAAARQILGEKHGTRDSDEAGV